jgi:hypothetical protein
MKTLYEGILDDMEDTIKQGDIRLGIEKELKTLAGLKPSKWKKTSDGDYIYIWECPNVLNSPDIKPNLPCECDSILFVIYMIKNDGRPITYTAYVDYTFMKNGKPYDKMFGLYSHYTNDRSKTLILRETNNFVSTMKHNNLVFISKHNQYPTCNSCPI